MNQNAPEFIICINHIDECPNEPAADFVVIDAKDSEDMSSGFIVLDHPSYLWKLRAAIDGFIKANNISPLIPTDYGK